MKPRKLYEIRMWPSATGYSRRISPKLKGFKRARRLVARLKRRGVEAFAAPLMVIN